jgi:hypothetical protein
MRRSKQTAKKCYFFEKPQLEGGSADREKAPPVQR